MRPAHCILLLIVFVAACAGSKDLTDPERALLITEMDFSDYGGEAGQTPQGSFAKKVDWLDGAREYTYETADDSEVYVYNTVTIETSRAKALAGDFAAKTGIKIGLLAGGVTEKPIEITRSIGTRATLTLLMKDGKPIGNTFTAIVDKASVTLLFSGIYFDTESDFQEFIQDKITRIASAPAGT